MLQEALVILIYIALIIFIISLIVLCIKLIGTLGRVDRLVENLTKKAETLDGVFNMLDIVSSKFNMIGDTLFGYISGVAGKLFGRRKKKRKDEDYE